MNKLSKTERDILCANHDWQNCRLSNDGLDIEAIQNNPSNPENIGEWINMGQLVDYDDELDELSQDEPETADQEGSEMYRIATIRNYYHGALGVNEAPEISDETYDTIAEAQAWINEQESSTYVLGNNESSRPDYYIIPVDVGDYLNRGRDGMDNYDWSDSECQHDDCGLCDDCIVMMAVQDREFVIKSAITQDDELEDCEPETVDLSEILENIKSGKYTEHEMTELPVAGDPPKGNHLGVWSWNGKQAIVGYSIDDFEIVDYGYFDDGPEPETVDLNEIYYLIDDEQYGDAAVMTKVELEEFASFCREQNPEWDDPTTVATNGRKVLDLYRFDIPMLMGNGEHVNIPYYYRRNGEYVGRVEK